MKVPQFYVVNVPDTVNVATLQPPAGAGNVVTVFVAGPTENAALPGALTNTMPEPPDPPLFVLPPPPPPPVLTVPEDPTAAPGDAEFPPPPGPPDPVVPNENPPPPPA
jgi:hypothetical protein